MNLSGRASRSWYLRFWEFRNLIDYLFKKCENGFYVHAPKESRITNKKQMAKYIGRYIRHPAVAESRTESYDAANVSFFYEDHEKQKHNADMPVDDFISALIRHIPDTQFKTVRYYGVYYRVRKKHFKELKDMVSIIQKTLPEYVKDWAPECNKCKCKMKFVMGWCNKPPPEKQFGNKISDWVYITPA